MARTPTLIKFTVRFRADSTFDMAGLLDMLRYDGARVTDWGRFIAPEGTPHAGREVYEVTLVSERLTSARWASFGLYPQVVA